MTAAFVPGGPAAVRPRPRFSARDTLLVARFELGEALRTRLLLVMVLLFVGGGGFSAWGFSKFIAQMENVSAQALGAPGSKQAGSQLGRLRHTPMYRTLMRAVSGDEQKAAYMASLPPMVLFYAWMTLAFTPWLVLLTSADTIAAEVASRSIRYTALRTGRLEYAVGKLIGQTVIVAAVIGLAGITFYVVSWIFMAGFAHGEMARGILSYAPLVLAHALPFVGFALFASMVMSSANAARALALGGMSILGILYGLSRAEELRTGSVSNALWDLAAYLSPFGHTDGLLYPGGAAFWTDLTICLALTAVYFGVGFAWLRKRDL